MNIIQQACRQIAGFESFYQKFTRRMVINDRAESTARSYGGSLAKMAFYFNCLPTALSMDQIEEYLYVVKGKTELCSDNIFKFTIAALRFVFRMEGLDEIRLQLPSIRKKRKLPIVLSKQEMTAMMNSPCLLKHRILIALLYGCGLRCGEVRNVKVTDIDLQRAVLHVRQAKGRKDRYLPLGKMLPGILEQYIKIQKPVTWLFPGQRWGKTDTRFYSVFDKKFGQRSVQWAIKRAAQLAGIVKPVNVHSLRHTYATHLLEDGVNILTIRELMGHAHVRTTMIYLHVAQVDNRHARSPFDTLEGVSVIGSIQGTFNF